MKRPRTDLRPMPSSSSPSPSSPSPSSTSSSPTSSSPPFSPPSQLPSTALRTLSLSPPTPTAPPSASSSYSTSSSLSSTSTSSTLEYTPCPICYEILGREVLASHVAREHSPLGDLAAAGAQGSGPPQKRHKSSEKSSTRNDRRSSHLHHNQSSAGGAHEGGGYHNLKPSWPGRAIERCTNGSKNGSKANGTSTTMPTPQGSTYPAPRRPGTAIRCPIPDCTSVIQPDEWEEHFQLHEIEIALGEKERLDKREANDYDLLQRYAAVDEEHGGLASASSTVQKGAYVQQYLRSLERDCGAHRMSLVEAFRKKDKLLDVMQGPDTETLTPDVIPALKACYQGRGMYGIDKVMICSAASHYAYGRGDDGWGCGYRNIQMICSGLMSNEAYKSVLFEGRGYIPSIPVIQAFIEQAWARGFDEEGAKQLGFSLSGGKKWIGSMECAALLRSFGINCTVVDFFRATGPDGTHPELLNWVWNYFDAYTATTPSLAHGASTLDSFLLRPPSSSASSSSSSLSPSTPPSEHTQSSDTKERQTALERRPSPSSSSRSPSLYSTTFIPPMFLQHEGHSRTIVGIEKRKNGTLHLLILDPVHTGEKVTTALANRQRRIFRHSINSLKHRQYQLVAVEAHHARRCMTLAEMEESKVIRTVRIPTTPTSSSNQ